MRLQVLLDEVEHVDIGLLEVSGDREVDVASVTHDSRRVVPGGLFACVPGLQFDGHEHAVEAVENGAVALLVERALPISVSQIQVRDVRIALGPVASAAMGRPSHDMACLGVTGTNGKTSTTYLLEAIGQADGRPVGVIGTTGARVGGVPVPLEHTTPEAPDVQRLLREMIAAGNRSCVMEVSSHALALKRVDGTRFAAAIFTNLTRDHLDFHADMEQYFAAKRRLFEMLAPSAPGVINADDPRAATLSQVCATSLTYGMQKPADVRPEDVSMDLHGVRFRAVTPAGPVEIVSTLVGRPNVYNLLAATAAACALGVPGTAISAGLASLAGVPGRFELVSLPADDITVVVDYAHTDDALRNLIETARPLTRGRVVTVFGCGGDRDRPKRPLMGMVAARLSDVVVITSDNPRGEDPAGIIDEIRRGIPAGEVASGRTPDVIAVVDRAAAIEKAVASARPGDLVLIAGKGHEKTQHIGTRVLPFDDADVAKAAIARRHQRSA